MIRTGMKAIPRGGMPEGYSWRRYRPGDADAWIQIIERTVGCKYSEEQFLRELRDSPRFDPKELFFIVEKQAGQAVATGCAGRVTRGDDRHGYVHFVGVLPEHQGKGLGRAIMLLVLRSFARRGFCDAILDTDDFRLPALAMYLWLGFVPRYTDADQCGRWAAVFKALGVAPIEGVDQSRGS
jgi:mycothiol synthase